MSSETVGSTIFAPNPDGPLHVGNALCFELEAREAARGCMDFNVRIDSSGHLINRYEECWRSVLAAEELLDRPINHIYDARDLYPKCLDAAIRLGAKGKRRDGSVVALDEFSWPIDEFPGKPTCTGFVYFVDIGGQQINDPIYPHRMPTEGAPVWHREARHKTTHPTWYQRGHLDEPMMAMLGAIDFLRHDSPFHARKILVTPFLAQCEVALMKLMGAKRWPMYAHIPEIRDEDGHVLNKSEGVAPEYVFEEWAKQWDTPKERREALMKLIHHSGKPFEWKHVRKCRWVAITPKGEVVNNG